MRSVRLDLIKDGDVLAKAVYDELGRVLLHSGSAIRTSYIDKLKLLGVERVYIQDEISEGIEIKDVATTETLQAGKVAIKEMFKNYIIKQKIEFISLYNVVTNVLEEILSNNDYVVNIYKLRSKKRDIFEHCINVSITATVVGSYIFNVRKLKDLTLGAMVHDMGYLLIPDAILNKPGKLTAEEKKIMQKHAQLGYNIFNSDINFPVYAKNIVQLHHEKCDGSGYPFGIKKDQISELTRLVTICDKFDNMMNPKPWMQKRRTYEVFEELEQLTQTELDPDLFEHFKKHVAVYPTGQAVLLSNGCKGIVSRQNLKMLTRPVVRVVIDSKGNKEKVPYEYDLMRERTLFIIDEIEL